MTSGLSTHDDAGAFLENVVSLYNAGVRTRDFTGFAALLAQDAVLDFEGTAERGPLEGKAAVEQHLRDEPPEDPIRVKRWKETPESIVAEFAWTDIPEGGGCLFLEKRADGRITRITIALGGPRRQFR